MMNREYGFTVIEISFVLVVLSMLAVYARVDLREHLERETLDATVNDLHSLREMALSYYSYHKHWPDRMEQLDDWLQGADIRTKSPLGFDYHLTVDDVGTSSATITRLRVAMATAGTQRARNLQDLMGVWAVAEQSTLTMNILPPDRLLAENAPPYLLENDIRMRNHNMHNLDHIRLYKDGAGITLIVDRLFVYNFVADKLYAKNYVDNFPYGPFFKNDLRAVIINPRVQDVRY